MSALRAEVLAIQNPALGAGLIWRFACGYCPKNSAAGVPLPLLFLVLPAVLHSRTADGIASTRQQSGLRLFAQKFEREGDVLLSLHSRALAMRALSQKSLELAVASGIVSLVPVDGVVWPRSYTSIHGAPPVVEGMLKAAQKLGGWCAELSLFEVAGILRVEL